MVDSGANVQNQDILSNQTALFYAAREGKLEIVKFLVEQGIDINHTDNKRQSALSYAKKNNKREVVEYLQ